MRGETPIKGIKPDAVQHPSHYTQLPIEVIDMIKILLTAANLPPFESYCFGNEIKYRMRAGLKDSIEQDINKAMKYMEFRNAAKDSKV